MKFVIRILKIISALLLILAFLGVIFSLLAGSSNKISKMSGYRLINVYGGSMEPAIELGSAIIVKKIKTKELGVGDIITFEPAREIGNPIIKTLTTHRIVEVIKKNHTFNFKTKGDANKTTDAGLVNESQVIGKVVLVIPFIGRLGFLVKTPFGFLLLIIIPGLTIISKEIINITKYVKRLKGEKAV